MNRVAQRDMIMTIRQLRRTLEAGKATVKQIDEIKTEIENDTSRSEEWKAQRMEAAQETQNQQLRRLGEIARPQIESLLEQVEAGRHAFDFRDQDFSRAVSLIAAAGKNLPAETAAQIASTFRGNLPALKTLKAVYSTQGLPTEPIDDMIKPLDGLGLDDSEAVTEFLGYSTSPMAHKNEWRTSSIEGMLSKYENGFALDCSVSPYRQDVQAIIDDPTKPAAIRERAASWLKHHGDGIDADDPGQIKLTADILKVWEKDAANAGQTAQAQGGE